MKTKVVEGKLGTPEMQAMLNDPRSRRGENRARITFNTDFYHLFVILGE